MQKLEFDDDILYLGIVNPNNRDIMESRLRAFKRFIGEHSMVMINEFYMTNSIKSKIRVSSIDEH